MGGDGNRRGRPVPDPVGKRCPTDVADLTGVETVTVDTGEVRVRIGGRGATEEDVELHRIAVTLPIQTLLDQVW
ncbi:hypothetical protein EGH21_19140 [Halomicroarcula sp. F13]|uniref:Transcription regulator TrmB C-terminal domain-containing protein n=1 Tax=Haloarcula rubra TaxID=2487747 RepID=A0AAW4PVB8_9EURY|nr:TrmB family transcriptional regulator sugar-binding domain-containing protein [Halomicroarcula rubra]MBX0325146.1 hypothetical protein [Halomicroarcula rubra]